MPTRTKLKKFPKGVKFVDRDGRSVREVLITIKDQCSVWAWLTLVLLLLSNIILLVAFLTNHWGVLTVRFEPEARNSNSENGNSSASEQGEWGNVAGDGSLECGLWQCCRDNGFCHGVRMPDFFGAARAFAVLALLGHVLAFALNIGHKIEKLFYYDLCTMSTLIALIFFSGISLLISVCCFALLWPNESPDFLGRHVVETRAYLSYSLHLAATIVPLTLLAGLSSIVEISQIRRRRPRADFVTAEEHQSRFGSPALISGDLYSIDEEAAQQDNAPETNERRDLEMTPIGKGK